MKIYSESIQMSNMEWSKVMMECVIEKSIINAEVARRSSFLFRNERRSIDGLR